MALSAADRFRAAVNAIEAGECPAIIAVLESSELAVERGRAFLRNYSSEYPDIDLVAFGSLGRLELTAASDLDHLLIFHGDASVSSTAEYVSRLLPDLSKELGGGNQLSPPGATGLFGGEVNRKDILGVIGLQDDSNHSLSRRILFLEESVSLWQPERHRELMLELVQRYTRLKPDVDQVPRFLVNDLVRYWRTLAVDYQAKSHTSYSLRYVKLLISRKFTFAASLLPVLLAPGNLNAGVSIDDHLTDVFLTPPLVRFGEAAVALRHDEEAMSHARGILQTMNAGVALLGDGDWREDIRIASATSEPKEAPAFRRALEITTVLQDSLSSLFMDTSVRSLTKDYLLF